METLPNGITIFNATPHPLTFWTEGWDEPVNVAPDEKIDAILTEFAQPEYTTFANYPGVEFVSIKSVSTEQGCEIINRVRREHPGAIIVGSLLAAQAYPQQVVAVVPAIGFERVPPAEKRMRPNKFTVYQF